MTQLVFDNEFAATSGVQDFKLSGYYPLPTGFPQKLKEDEYCDTVFASSFEERREAFIEFALNNPGVDTVKGFFFELIRVAHGNGPVHEALMFSALDYINQRKDCSDFIMAGVLRILFQLSESSRLPVGFLDKAKETVLGFKYWPDEPGIDSMCFWTENHHLIFSSCEYLAGQLYPDDVFSNSGMTGRQKKAKAEKRLHKWLELRFKTGFNEWLSNVYYDEDFPPLVNLLDFCDNPIIRENARSVIDLMFMDMACNSYKGQFACTHGRTYTEEKLNPYNESTIDTAKLMFGLGRFANKDNMSAVYFALSENYRLPNAVFNIATDTQAIVENKQKVSIQFKDAEKWGYGKFDTASAMALLSYGGYCHYRTFNHMILMLNEFRWWDNKFFMEFKPFKKIMQIGAKIGLTTAVAWLFRKDLSRNAFTEAHLYTYRTKDYQLSTAQDYRKSYGGDQHHIWQATLDGQAVCFTTHPGGYGMTAPNAYWHGSGFLPKALQYKNVAIIQYKTPKVIPVLIDQVLEFTHAFFPKDRFDEVCEENDWVFGRKNSGYIAMRSQHSTSWNTEGDYAEQDLIAQGRDNIWLVELGNEDEFGSFQEFKQRVSSAKVHFTRNGIRYQSPSQGLVTSGWNDPFVVDGAVITTRYDKRYENKYCRAEYGSESVQIEKGDLKLELRKQ